MTRHRPRTTPVDLEIGRLMRVHRCMAGYSMQDIADCLGISCQQVSKNERGSNRLTASRLHEISEILNVPPAALLPGAAPVEPYEHTREMRDLVRTYRRIASPEHRAAVRHLARSLAETEVVEMPQKGAA